jgi:hypothetical protein
LWFKRSPMKKNFQKVLLEELGIIFNPLVLAATNESALNDLLAFIGLDLEAITGLSKDQLAQSLTQFVNGYQQLVTAVENPPETLPEFIEALDGIANLIEVIAQLPTIIRNSIQTTPEQAERLFGDLLSFLVTSYLEVWHPTIYHLAVLLTIIDIPEETPTEPILDGDGNLVNLPYSRTELKLKRIAELLKDPVPLLKSEYLKSGGLATVEDAQYTADKLFPRLGMLLVSLGAHICYGFKPHYQIDFGEGGNEAAAGMLMVEVPLNIGEDLVGSSVGATLALSPADRGNLGLVVMPFGELVFTENFGYWEVVLDLTAGIECFAIGPDGLTLPEGLESLNLLGRLRAEKLPEDDAEDVAFLVGSAKGTRLEIGKFIITLEASFSQGEKDFGILIEAGSAAIVISPGDGDAFLEQTLPPQELRAEFDLAIGWSSKNGFYFRGSAGLEGTLPLHIVIPGFLSVDSIYLLLRPKEDSSLQGIAAITAALQLGPFIVVAERFGLEALISFPPEGGNLGPANLALGFKPADGAGLAINAGPVTGGGFLFYDKAKELYAGILLLEINETIMLTAIGLLTTRMPDGSKGFSLLVIITVEGFTPIQLGFGFTLNGVGGMLGVNRTVSTEFLQTGLRNGSLDSVLFPKDPIGKAPQVINGLNNAFPPARGHFIFSPMFIIGWGTPTIITAEIAFIFELPSPSRLVILGQLRSILPTEDAALICVKVDVLGIIDFNKKTISIDATLRNSRLIAYNLTGEMALRANWGENPNLLLAAGGFNPRFQAPAGFPMLERLAISLASGDNPRLRLEAYLALTSNTLQFGARLDLFASAAGFSIEGHLGFDTLFQFSPFSFIADISGAVVIKHGSNVLMSVQLVMELSGPVPWHVKGQLSFSFLGINFSVSFDKKFGPDERPPLPEPVDVKPLLIEALRDLKNWSCQLPREEHPRITLREIPSSGEVLVHPLSDLTVNQRVVPLNQQISKFGNTTPGKDRFFKISSVQIGGRPLPAQPETLTDFFAAAQFIEMRDDEKLSRPSFERMESGISIGTDTIAAGVPVEVGIEYETIIVDEKMAANGGRGEKYRPQMNVVKSQARLGSAGQKAMGRKSRVKDREKGLGIVVREPAYTLATTDDLTIPKLSDLTITGTSHAAVTEALKKYLTDHPEKRGRLQVVPNAGSK